MILSLPLGVRQELRNTYMAQEALEQAAKKAGVTIKVETHGQIGVEKRIDSRRNRKCKSSHHRC